MPKRTLCISAVHTPATLIGMLEGVCATLVVAFLAVNTLGSCVPSYGMLEGTLHVVAIHSVSTLG